MTRRWISMITVWILLLYTISTAVVTVNVQAQETKENVQSEQSTEQEGDLIEAPAGVLMEAQTGTLVYEKDKDTRRSPASITKIMTLILIFDALEKGSLRLDELVTTSAYAKSMGGSQVFLEEGEKQTVETMIKCIVVASGNDASVAMAEHICGSEAEFVRHMNERAKGLGMENTHFEDCCGLTDSSNHYTSAQDVAIMSRELITKYPQILNYSSIWMENITHVTARGSSEFGLTNTNKLLRSYEGCVGLKTGSTSTAKYCVSAVAQKNGITLISVVMAAPDYKVRFKDAAAMLNYGFSRCSLYIDKEMPELSQLPLEKGKEKMVPLTYEKQFQFVSTDGTPLTDVSRKQMLPSKVQAPVRKGESAGEIVYYAGDREIGRVGILYGKTVQEADYPDCIRELWKEFLL